MKAFLLAAGLGTRLRPITDTIPKCLVPVGGRPLLDHWIDQLMSQGVEKIMINTHYLHDQVESFVSNSRYASSIELVFEEELLGTGGSVLRNLWFFAGENECLIAHADNYTTIDLPKFINAFRQRPDDVHITMMTFEAHDPCNCGIVEVNDEGLVVGFHEKVENPPGSTANAAVYLFDDEALQFIASAQGPFIDISTQILPSFVGRMNVFHNQEFLIDIGSPDNLEKANKLALDGR